MARLEGKIVLVTGAAGAIGSAIARAVIEQGGVAITSDLAGRGSADHALDVTSESDWQRVIAAIAASAGRLDGLVNAAGIVAVGSVEDTDFATWRRVMAINLDGTFLGCKYGVPLLRRAGGSIVNISSVSGLVGGHNLAAYNASKGGVRLLTKSVALLRRPAETAGALQFGAPGLYRRSAGRRYHRTLPRSGHRPRTSLRNRSARPFRHAQRSRRPVRLSALDESAFSPAPSSCSMAG